MTATVQAQSAGAAVDDRIAVYLPSLDIWTDGGRVAFVLPGGVITEDGFFVEMARLRVKK